MSQPDRFPEFPPDSVMHGIQPPAPDVMPDARQLHQQGEVVDPATASWFTPTRRQAELQSASGVADELIARAGIHLEVDELGPLPATLGEDATAADTPLFREIEERRNEPDAALPARTVAAAQVATESLIQPLRLAGPNHFEREMEAAAADTSFGASAQQWATGELESMRGARLGRIRAQLAEVSDEAILEATIKTTSDPEARRLVAQRQYELYLERQEREEAERAEAQLPDQGDLERQLTELAASTSDDSERRRIEERLAELRALRMRDAGPMQVAGLRVRDPSVDMDAAPVGEAGVADSTYVPTVDEKREVARAGGQHDVYAFGAEEAVVALERAKYGLQHRIWVEGTPGSFNKGKWVHPEELGYKWLPINLADAEGEWHWVQPEEAGFTRASVDPENPESPEYWRHPDGYTIGYKDATGQQDPEADPQA